MLLNCACILVRVLEKQDFITSYFIVSLCIGMAIMALALALSVLALLTSLNITHYPTDSSAKLKDLRLPWDEQAKKFLRGDLWD